LLEFLRRPSNPDEDDQPEKRFSFHFYFDSSDDDFRHHRKCFVETRNKTESQRKVAIKPQISSKTKTIFEKLLMKKMQPTSTVAPEEGTQENDEEIQFALQDTITGFVETELLRSSSSSLEQNALLQVFFRKTTNESQRKKAENNDNKKNDSVLGKRRLSKAERKKLSKQRKVVDDVSEENKTRERSIEVGDDDEDNDNSDDDDKGVTAAGQSYYDFSVLFAVECSPLVPSSSSRNSKHKVSITLQTDRLLVENYLNYFFRLSKK
jgi:hypothetical protein